MYTYTGFPSNTTNNFYCNTEIFRNFWDPTKTRVMHVVSESKCGVFMYIDT
jgi:hypothetical protein